MRSGWRPGARRHRSPPIAAVLFKAVQFGVLAIFIWYGFDLRRKHGMTPLALPWLTRVMKVVSCVVVVLYVYVLWAVHELVWTDVLALVFTTSGAALVRAAKQALGDSHTWTGYCMEAPTLVVSGIYAYLRHPLYTGVYLFEIGALWTFVPRLDMLPVWGVVLAGICLLYAMSFNATMAALETRRMTRRFGPEFEAYRERVRAFIPLRRRPGAA